MLNEKALDAAGLKLGRLIVADEARADMARQVIEAFIAALPDDGLVKEARTAAARIEEQWTSMTTPAIAMKNLGQTKAGLFRRLAVALKAARVKADVMPDLVKEACRIANDLELEVSHMDTCYSTALEAVGILRVLAAAPEPPK